MADESADKPLSFEQFRKSVTNGFDKNILKKGIEQGIDLNQKVGSNSLFCYMVKRAWSGEDSIKLIKLALDKGADPNLKCENGFTPFMMAAGMKKKDFLEPFLNSPKLDWNITSDEGKTVLFYAYSHDKDVFKRLLEANPTKQSINTITKHGDSILHRYITSNRNSDDGAILDKLHELGADFSITSPTGLPPLQYAFSDGSNLFFIKDNLLNSIIKNGASALQKNSFGQDALHLLLSLDLRSNTAKNVFNIVFAAPDVKDTVDSEGNNLLLALFLKQKQLKNESLEDKCKTLIDLKSDLTAVNNDGISVLMAAAYSGCSKCLETLIEAKAPLNPNGAVPLSTVFFAVKGKISGNSLEKLIDYGADVNQKDPETGISPLMSALLSSAEYSTVYSLISKGADVNAMDNEGRNALMAMAYLDPDPKVARYLTSAGANLEQKDKNGLGPLDYLEKSPYKLNLKNEKYDELKKILAGEKK